MDLLGPTKTRPNNKKKAPEAQSGAEQTLHSPRPFQNLPLRSLILPTDDFPLSFASSSLELATKSAFCVRSSDPLPVRRSSAEPMATVPLSVPSIKGVVRVSPPLTLGRSRTGYSKPLVVRAATAIAPKYTSIKPVGNRVLVKIKSGEDKTTGGLYLPTTAQKKSQEGEVVATGDGYTIGSTKVDLSVQEGNKVVYSKYAGTELEFNGTNHLLLKEDDIIGILDTDDIKGLKPLGDRVLIKIAEAEEKTSGGLILTEQAKEKPSVGTVVAVGPGSLDEDGKRKPINISPGSTVLYSKYAGTEFKGSDGTEYITLRVSDVMAVLSS